MHINFSIAATITEALFRIIEFKYFQLLAHQYYQTHLLHAIIIILKLQGIVTSFMQLMNGLDTSYLTSISLYCLAFPWRTSSSQSIMTYYPPLFMHLLSCIHNNSWNGSRIVINSSCQRLVIHNNTCTISMHSCIASQNFHPYLCMHIYNI